MDTKEVQRGKRRGWIKNAAIIFLAIMLVLTFFSNTIMNRSLPEVATQYVSSGTISAKIRGTGTVTANSAYDVKVKENRVIKTVAVKKGDTVEVGDVLFLLEEGESTSTQELRDQLEEAQYNYRLLLLNSPYINSTADNLAVERLQEALDKAIEERDLSYVTDSQIASAESDVVDKEIAAQIAADKVTDIDDAIADLNEQISGLGGGSGDGKVDGTLYDALVEATIARETAYLRYKDIIFENPDSLFYLAKNKYNNNFYPGAVPVPDQDGYYYSNLTADNIAAMQAYAYEVSGQSGTVEDGTGSDTESVDITLYGVVDYLTGFTAIKTAEEQYSAAKQAYDNANSSAIGSMMESAQLANLKAQLENLNDQKKTAEKEKTAADSALEDANKLLETLNTKKQNYKDLDAAVQSAEDALEDKLLSLQDSQHSSTVEKSKYNLDVEKAKKTIEELQAKIDGSSEEGLGDTITSPVAGTVTAINISAGSTTEYDVSLMTIEEKDRGYMASISVTNEQAQKVKVGDSAEVTSNYWGANITAKLATITNDPSNPGQGKLLNFVVEGEVSAGDQVNLAIGQKSANYELIVPNSALRSDANGYFVLTVQTKSSPLGNRYVATRVDVQVLASDDTNTAVSGGLVSYDYVITTSSAPLTPGQLVRLVEN